MAKERIGFIGVGLMGHGMAKNIAGKGHPLIVLGHRNRTPIDDLVKRGAKSQPCREIDRSSCRAGMQLASPASGCPHARVRADHRVYNRLTALTLRRRKS